MKKVTIDLRHQDVDELDVLLLSEYDACTINNDSRITLYSRKACNAKNISLSKSVNISSPSYSGGSSMQSDSLASYHSAYNDGSLAHWRQEFSEGRIVWAKSSTNRPYWPSFVLDVFEKYVHLYYISRSKFSSHSSPVAVETSKVIPYSPAAVKAMTNDGLGYYKSLQLWDYMSDFYNAVLLAKTFINFQKHGFFKSQHQIYDFFNSDLPRTQPKDSHTPTGFSEQRTIRRRSCSAKSEDILRPSKRKKTVQSANACDSSAFQQNVLKSQHQINDLFNSDLPRSLPKDLDTPLGFSEQRTIRRRSCSTQSEDILGPSQRKKTVQSANACDSSAFQQRVYRHILTGNCRKYLQRILNGTVICERWKTSQESNLSKPKLRSWRQTHINPYFPVERYRDNVMINLRKILFTQERRMGSKYPLPKFFQLLYDVLYPEAIIEGIRKLGKLQYHDADMIYRNTVMPVDGNDKSFHKVLSHRERLLVQSRMTSLAV